MKFPWQTPKQADLVSPQRSSYGLALSIALGGKPFYEGTVDPAVVARRRRRNKAARIARRAHR